MLIGSSGRITSARIGAASPQQSASNEPRVPVAICEQVVTERLKAAG